MLLFIRYQAFLCHRWWWSLSLTLLVSSLMVESLPHTSCVIADGGVSPSHFLCHRWWWSLSLTLLVSSLMVESLPHTSCVIADGGVSPSHFLHTDAALTALYLTAPPTFMHDVHWIQLSVTLLLQTPDGHAPSPGTTPPPPPLTISFFFPAFTFIPLTNKLALYSANFFLSFAIRTRSSAYSTQACFSLLQNVPRPWSIVFLYLWKFDGGIK